MVETTVKVAKAVTSLVKPDSEDEAEDSEKDKSEKAEKVKTEKAKSAKDEAAEEPETEEDTVAEDAEKYLKHIVAKAQAQVLQKPKQVKTDEELAAIRARAEALAASMAKPQATLVEHEDEPKEAEESAEPVTGLRVADVAPKAVTAAPTEPAAEGTGLKVSEVLAPQGTEAAEKAPVSEKAPVTKAPSATEAASSAQDTEQPQVQAESKVEPQVQAAPKDAESK